MSLKINTYELFKVKDMIKKCENSLNDAKSKISSIVIPSDFPEAETLKVIFGKITNLESQTDWLVRDVEAIINNFDVAEMLNKLLSNNLLWKKAEDLLGEKTEKNILYSDLFFKSTKTYGIDQHCTQPNNLHFPAVLAERQKTIEYMQKFYKMSKKDAAKTLNLMEGKSSNSVGLCTYSAMSNAIAQHYKNNPKQFAKDFGYPLLTNYGTKKKTINEFLMVDLFINTNQKLFRKNKKGETRLNEDLIYMDWVEKGYKVATWDKYYIDRHADNSDKEITSFLQKRTGRKDISVKCIENTFQNNIKYINDNNNNSAIIYDDRVEMSKYLKNKQKDILKSEKDEGKEILLDIHPKKGKAVLMIGKDRISECGGGHMMYVTEVLDKGVWVSSWGEKYYITYDSIINNCKSFSFYNFEFND